MARLIDLLTPGINSVIADKIVKHYTQMKHNYLLEKHGPTEVDGGQFVEAVARAIENEAFGSFTPIVHKIDIDKVFKRVESKKGQLDESLRIDVPRTLRSIYDVRNRRGAAHLGLFDPNLMDSTYVISTCDWVMAELVRIYSSVTPEDAQSIVGTIIERKIPLVEEFEDDLMVLDPDMRMNEQILILLYKKEGKYIDADTLLRWIPKSTKKVIERSIEFLADLRLVHQNSGSKITRRGIKVVEGPKPIDADLAINRISDFLRLKEATNHNQRVLATGYWLDQKYGRESFNSEDLIILLRQANTKPPANPSHHLSMNVGMGYLRRVDSGTYTITDEGLSFAYLRFS